MNPQLHNPIENWFSRDSIHINTKISKPFKLILALWTGVFQVCLNITGRQGSPENSGSDD